MLRESFMFFYAVLLSALIHCGAPYKILALTLMVTPSHKIPLEPLLEELAVRGHEVTVVSPIRPKKSVENLKEVLTFDLDTVLKIPNIFEMKERGENVQPVNLLTSYSEICLAGLESPALKALRNETFDLVIIPVVFNECAGAYARSVYDAPIILFSPVGAPSFITTFYGNPSPPSFVPFLFAGLPQQMTFFQRVESLLLEGIVRTMVYNMAFPSIETKYREILNDSTVPSVEEMLKSTSLILSNSHFSISYRRPFLPNIIEVGGMHCHPSKALPKNLEDCVSAAGPEGFILFSMGTALKPSDISLERRQGIISALSKIKQRVIWKWDGEPIVDLPSNVMLSKWLPQQDLLGHSKIRLFVTHGGFGSTTEAVYHGVPLVGIPMFSDQEMNMKEMEHAGVGITLNFLDLSEETLLSAISTVLSNPMYSTNVKRLSNIFRDQPQKPLDRAVFWTEYVIRHKGAHHLMSAGKDLNFFEFHSLDVIAFLTILIFLITGIIFILLKFAFTKLISFFSKSIGSGISEKKRN